VPRTRVRLIVAAALIAVTALAACNPNKPPVPSITDATIVVGIADDAPGFAVGDVNPAGFDIDLMNAIGAGLHTQVSPTILTSRDRAGYLKNRKATIVVDTYSITSLRNRDGIDFAGPYMVSPQALLVRANDTSIVHKADIAGKSVCTVKSTTGGGVVLPGANMTTTETTTKECIDLLAAGGTDAVFTDTLILYGYGHAYPGKFKVVLDGVFGELQYYGVGLYGRSHTDCLKLDDVISEYLRTQWRHDFQDTLQDAVAAYPGSDTSGGDFESRFKPKASDMTTLSCKL
jgi:glutamate transport system substrate-binding protein